MVQQLGVASSVDVGRDVARDVDMVMSDIVSDLSVVYKGPLIFVQSGAASLAASGCWQSAASDQGVDSRCFDLHQHPSRLVPVSNIDVGTETCHSMKPEAFRAAIGKIHVACISGGNGRSLIEVLTLFTPLFGRVAYLVVDDWFQPGHRAAKRCTARGIGAERAFRSWHKLHPRWVVDKVAPCRLKTFDSPRFSGQVLKLTWVND